MATKHSDQEIESIENDLAAISEADEAARILILQMRRRVDLEELIRIRAALYRIWLRAIERRQRAGRKLRTTRQVVFTRTSGSQKPRQAAGHRQTKASG